MKSTKINFINAFSILSEFWWKKPVIENRWDSIRGFGTSIQTLQNALFKYSIRSSKTDLPSLWFMIVFFSHFFRVYPLPPFYFTHIKNPTWTHPKKFNYTQTSAICFRNSDARKFIKGNQTRPPFENSKLFHCFS